MRILLLTQWFQPESTFKGLPFALELMKHGHQVEVLTGFPNYPTGRIYPPYQQSARLIEDMEGVRVVRVPLYPSHDRSAVRRSVNYLSFAASAATIGLASVKRPDIVYAYHPPATAVLPAWIYNKLAHIPYVVDIQDLWPDTLTATGMFSSSLGLKAINAYCNQLYSAAAHIVVLSPGFQELLTTRGVPREKLSVIPNWADDDIMKPAARDDALAKRYGLAGRFNIMFAGNLGLAQGLDSVLASAVHLQSRCPQAQYVFVGGGVAHERIQREVTEKGLSNVVFIERQPLAQMPALFALADTMLVHLKDLPLFRITIPSKIQAYMATGRPILCAVAGDAAKLVEQAKAGVTCPPEDPSALADAVCQLALCTQSERDQLGANALRYYEQELSMKVGVARFSDLFETVRATKH